MNWNAFLAALLGTTIPAFLVSLLMLYLNHRTNRSIEQYKSASARDLSDHQIWHEKRIASLLAIHDSFRKYLNFLRKSLYVSPPTGLDVTPMHDFSNSIEEHLVYLNDDLRRTVVGYQGELLQFWNWTVTLRDDNDPECWKQVQNRLDYEIPGYLDKLRQFINSYADPGYSTDDPGQAMESKKT